MAELLLNVVDSVVTFGGKPLFDGLSFNIHEGDRICLVGKNGAGKTTLMHMITGEKELDGGDRWERPGLTVGYLQQEVHPKPGQTVLEFIFEGLPKEKQDEEHRYKVDMVIAPFELHVDDIMTDLSGGQLRRAALARSLVEEPDVLLLDEPTNHLDLEAIEWLENYLNSYRGTLLCVSHDKTFLANITNRIFWLDRGAIRTCPKGFAHFDEWSSMLLEQEARELENREKALALEIEWASRGVKARRKRNVRRVDNVRKEREKLKADKSLFRKTMKKVELEPLTSAESSRIVTEFYNVSKKYVAEDGREKIILDKFNLRIMRGDRFGILGKNGSGKTSFLKMLVDEMKQDSGSIKMAKTIEFSYFDQKRQDLDTKKTLWETLCPNGGDYVEVGGKMRHVCGYLKDFLFDPKNAKDRVGTLSGGQKNRLLLAKILANPGNLLILDEPTNDLDMDTLEMLEDILSKYEGTLIVVSHDRDFLDQTVTKILAFEGDGVVDGYIGGYSDYLAAKAEQDANNVASKNKENHQTNPALGSASAADQQADQKPNKPKKLSYKYQRELDMLPEKMEKLQRQIEGHKATLANAELYMKDPEGFDVAMKGLSAAQEALEAAELRWLELEEMKASD